MLARKDNRGIELGVFAQSGLWNAAPAETLDTTVGGQRQECGSSEAGPPRPLRGTSFLWSLTSPFCSKNTKINMAFSEPS